MAADRNASYAEDLRSADGFMVAAAAIRGIGETLGSRNVHSAPFAEWADKLVGAAANLRRGQPAPEDDRRRDRFERHPMQDIRDAARAAWRSVPKPQRECLLLNVLGDDNLTLRELAKRLDTKVRTPECGDELIVYGDNIRPLVVCLVQAGELERAAEVFRNKPRYRYSRRRALEGPIIDLERAFNDLGMDKGSE